MRGGRGGGRLGGGVDKPCSEPRRQGGVKDGGGGLECERHNV